MLCRSRFSAKGNFFLQRRSPEALESRDWAAVHHIDTAILEDLRQTSESADPSLIGFRDRAFEHRWMLAMPMSAAHVQAKKQDLRGPSVNRDVHGLIAAVAARSHRTRVIVESTVPRVPQLQNSKNVLARDLQTTELVSVEILWVCPPLRICRVEHVGPRRQPKCAVDDDGRDASLFDAVCDGLGHRLAGSENCNRPTFPHPRNRPHAQARTNAPSLPLRPGSPFSPRKPSRPSRPFLTDSCQSSDEPGTALVDLFACQRHPSRVTVSPLA